MTRFLLSILMVTAGLVVVAGTATAGLPDPGNSTVSPIMTGSACGVTTADTYVVVVRDINGAPVGGATVTIDFSTASGNSGISAPAHLHAVQIPPTVVDCPNQTLSQVADASGTATFEGLFGGAENTASVEVRAEGVLLRLIKVRSTDMNDNGETELGDLNLFRINFFLSPSAEESDFNQSGSTELGDLNIFRVEFFAGCVVPRCP